MLDTATVSDDSYVEGGIDKGLGDEGLLDNRWSQALAAYTRLSVRFPHMAPIFVTLIVGTSEHQKRNVNL